MAASVFGAREAFRAEAQMEVAEERAAPFTLSLTPPTRP